jgi:hypothetical protein
MYYGLGVFLAWLLTAVSASLMTFPIPTAAVRPALSDSPCIQPEIDLELLLVVAYPVLAVIDTCRCGLSGTCNATFEATSVVLVMAALISLPMFKLTWPPGSTPTSRALIWALLFNMSFVSLFFQLSTGACTPAWGPMWHVCTLGVGMCPMLPFFNRIFTWRLKVTEAELLEAMQNHSFVVFLQAICLRHGILHLIGISLLTTLPIAGAALEDDGQIAALVIAVGAIAWRWRGLLADDERRTTLVAVVNNFAVRFDHVFLSVID